MPTDKATMRRQLFQLYAANLALHRPELSGRFLCPICGSLHGADAVEAPSLAVDIAHIYPQAAGTSPETLTCKACNSRLGSHVDSHVVREHEIGGALDGSGSAAIDARLRDDAGNSMGASVRRVGNHWHFNAIAKQTNPAEGQAIVDAVTANKRIKFRLRTRPANIYRISLGLLHSAYLAMFRRFGYEYVFHADTGWIRSLLDGIMLPITLNAVDVPSALRQDVPPFFEPMAVLLGGVPCVGVVLPPPHNQLYARMIVLPGFAPTGGLDQLSIPDGAVEIHLRQFINGEFASPLADPRFAQVGRERWSVLQKELRGA